MTVRADILAGRAVILVNIQDNIDKQLKTIRSRMRVFANNISEIGGDLFRGGLAGSLAAVFPVKEFVSFQDSMLFLQTKLKDTGVDIKALEELVRELGRTTSFTSREVAEAGAVLAQAGLGAKVAPTLQPVLDLARGSRIDLDTAGRILANVMSSYEVAAEDASSIASKLITAARLGTTDVIAIGESMKEMLTTMRQLNVPLEDTLAMISQLSKVSLRGTKAGTSLNTAFANLASKLDQINELGIPIREEELSNPIAVLRKLGAAMDQITDPAKVQTLQSLFNIRGGRGFGGLLIQDLDELEANIHKIQNAGDEARDMALLMDSQLGGVGRRALSAFQEGLISLGETTEGPLTRIGENVQKVFQNIGNLARENPRLVQTMLAIPPIALATGVSFLLLSTAISKVLMLVGPLLSANALIFKSLGAIAGANIKVAKTMFDAGRRGAMAIPHGPDIPFVKMITGAGRGIATASRFAATQAATGFTSAFAKIAQSKFASYVKFIFGPLIHIVKVVHSISRGITSALLLSGGVATPRSFMDIANAVRTLYASLPGIATALRTTGTAAQLTAGHFLTMANNARLMVQMGIGDMGRSLARLPSIIRGASLQKIFTSTIADGMVHGVARGLQAFNKVFKASPTMRGATMLGDAVFGKQFGRRLNVSLGTHLRTAFGLLGRGGLARSAGTLFTGLFRGLRAGLRGLASVDYIRILFRSFQGLWTVAKGFLTVLNGIRRVLFSLSGWLLIAEGLILFGDKIPIVKDALEGLGRAFSNVFKNLGNMFRDIGDELSWIGSGLRLMFSGNIEIGLEHISKGFQNIGTAIKDGVWYTWRNFVKDIEPGALMIRNAITGIIGVFEALVATIGAIFGTAFEKGTIIVKSDGSLLELFQSIFSPDNFKQFFTFVISFIGEIGKGLISVVEFIGDVLIDIHKVFMAILTGLSKIPGGVGSSAQTALDEINEPTGPNAERIKQLRAGIAEREAILSGISGRFVSDEQRQAIEQIIADAKAELIELGDAVTPTKTPAQIRADLDKKLQEILDEVNDAIVSTLGERPELNRRARLAQEGLAEFGGMQEQLGDLFDPLQAIKDEFNGVADASEVLGTIMEDVSRDLEEERRNLLTQMAEGAKRDLPQAAEVAQAKEQAAGIGQAIKAVVGDFESTRFRQLQFSGQKLDELRNRLLEEGNEELAQINNKIQPVVFA